MYHLIKIFKNSKKIKDIIICTTTKSEDNQIYQFAKKNNLKCFRGSELNVLDRMLSAAKKFGDFDHLIRVTGDDILIDGYYLDLAINHHLKTNSEYTDHKLLPSGQKRKFFHMNF